MKSSAAAGLFGANSSTGFASGPNQAPAQGRSTSRSRSPVPRRNQGDESVSKETELNPLEQAAEALRAVQAAFSPETSASLKKFVGDGTMRADELDVKCLLILQALSAQLQAEVLDYIEGERVFFLNARSKSGFVVAACEKARTGSLDARGLRFKDPWCEHLLSVAQPKKVQVDLDSEQDWLAKHGHEPARLLINLSADKDLGVTSVTLAVNLTQSAETIKKRLAVIGVKIPVNKMRLRAARVGFLKGTKTLAFYNIQSGSELQLLCKTRAGVALKKDHSDGFDPALCQ